MNPFDIPIAPGHDLEMVSGIDICDFCSPPQPAPWVYPCRSFALPLDFRPFGGREMRSNGDWGACVACADLIEANKRKELVQRCGHTQSELIEFQTKVIDLFFKHRTNKPRFYVGEGMDENGGKGFGDTVVVIVKDEKQ